ncbi:MAG TPA: S41 family peptidase [Pyrinomonadaceae bacterium]|jgi:carboxyl-terminal processing protease
MMKRKLFVCPSRLAFAVALFLVATCGASLLPQAQKATSTDRERGQVMLRTIKDDLKKNYYDPTVRGMDLDARFKAAEEKMKQADSNSQIMGIIAQILVELDDSHTFFMPPARVSSVEYGWQVQSVGDKNYVVAVKPKSDAEAKGLQPGDEVLAVDGRKPSRANLWLFKYLYYTLRPQGAMQLAIRKPDGKEMQMVVAAKVKTSKRVTDLTNNDEIWHLIRESQNEDRLNAHRYYLPEDLMIWKMPQFDMAEADVDTMADKFRKRKALILDLRGNGGGLVKNLERLVGYFFDKDIKIADLKGRKEMKPMMAKTRGDKAFKGELVVLIDSESGSASELFARIIQLEKRGKVIGDKSAGAVMQSKHLSHQMGVDIIVPYGVSITDADVIMSDGKSLEHVGVTPDEVILPTAADLAAGRDPVLARAAELIGLNLSPEKAGSMFPIEWRK